MSGATAAWTTNLPGQRIEDGKKKRRGQIY